MKHLFLYPVVLMAALLFSLDLTAAKNDPWKKACTDEKKPETCRISQVRYITKEVDGKQKVVGKALSLTVIYATDAKSGKRTPFMSIQMPLGVDLRAGAVFRVDKGKEIHVPYLRCTNDGCDASYRLDSGFIKLLKAGKIFYVGVRPWGDSKSSVFEASLKGFTKAFKALK